LNKSNAGASTAQVLAQHRRYYAQADDGNWAVVFPQDYGRIAALGHQVHSPADSAHDGEGAYRSQ